MQKLIENARIAAEAAKDAIERVRDKIAKDDPRYDMVDDAHLGAGWAVRRMKDLENVMP